MKVLTRSCDRKAKTVSCSVCAINFGSGGNSMPRCPMVVAKEELEEDEDIREILLTGERVTWCDCIMRADGAG